MKFEEGIVENDRVNFKGCVERGELGDRIK